MQIISWNVASIRARLPLLIELLKEKQPDIIFLQEIKTLSETFPFAELQAHGYHSYINGQKGFNGVAILSKKPLQEIQTTLPGMESDEQARFIQAGDEKNIYISVYVPNGNPALNNPTDTSRLTYKLNWMKSLNHYLKHLSTTEKSIILGGDFNVIARDEDVYDAAAFTGNALIIPQVRTLFREMEQTPLINPLRICHPTEKIYSFWDFQMGAARRNLGILLDYIFISPIFKSDLLESGIYTEYRYKQKPSDHAPIYIQLT